MQNKRLNAAGRRASLGLVLLLWAGGNGGCTFWKSPEQPATQAATQPATAPPALPTPKPTELQTSAPTKPGVLYLRMNNVLLERHRDPEQPLVQLGQAEAVWKQVPAPQAEGQALVAQVQLRQPIVNVIIKEPARPAGDWRATLREAMPVVLDSLHIIGGQVRYRDQTYAPAIELDAWDIDATVLNLTNAEKVADTRFARLAAQAHLTGAGKFRIAGQLDVLNTPPSFDIRAQLTDLDMLALNQYFKAYGNFDVSSGSMSLFTELVAEAGRYDGSVKIIIKDLNILHWQDLQQEGLTQFFWEGLLGIGAAILSEDGAQAAVVPLSGSFDDPAIDVWDALASALRHAFVDTITPGFRGVGQGAEGAFRGEPIPATPDKP